LYRLTLNTLIDQSSSPTAPLVLDDRNADVTNFILTLERVLSFRLRGKEKQMILKLCYYVLIAIGTAIFLGFCSTSMYWFISAK
jgi:hypothetical protein